MAYQYKDTIEYSSDDWVLVGYTNMSPNRPPNFNQGNSSSSEAGTPINDPGLQIMNMNVNRNHNPFIGNAPASYPSSNNGSIRAPDGPERKDPPNRFLIVAPGPGFGEREHLRRASLDEMEDQVNSSPSRWAQTLPPIESSVQIPLEEVPPTWLRQNTHMVGPTSTTRATRGKRSSGSTSSGSGDATNSASRSSNVAGAGGWTGDQVWGSWPAEIEDDAIEDEDEDEGGE